jgi:hypothetical protein
VARHYHHITWRIEPIFMLPEELARVPFDAIPHHGSANAFGHRYAQTRAPVRCRQHIPHKRRRDLLLAVLKDTLELASVPQSFAGC